MGFQHRLVLLSILGGLPGTGIALYLLWSGPSSLKVQATLTAFILVVWTGCVVSLISHVVFPLRTLSNLLGAFREGDFSLRASGAKRQDVLGDVMVEVNALGEILRTQRLGALETRRLLQKFLQEIDVAVFAFDPDRRLRLVNREGERLLGRRSEQLLGHTAEKIGLNDYLDHPVPTVVEVSLPGGAGRWELRRGVYHEAGKPHQLILLSDLTRTLHEENRQAWERLLQILRHEINNSLTPIGSIAGSLRSLLERTPRSEDWEEDMRQGLELISERSDALLRFVTAYSQVTRLPKPSPSPLNVREWVQRVVGLEHRMEVTVTAGPDVTILADTDQMEQLLINLVRNAVDAVQQSGSRVDVGWRADQETLEVWVEDDGPGLSPDAQVFVPFFTTKPEGAGIGLTLSRQIAQVHGGTLTLQNRPSTSGCRATLRLPLTPPKDTNA